MDGKIDSISQDIAIVKIKDVEQAAKLNTLEEKFEKLANKYNTIDERLKKMESEFIQKESMNSLLEDMDSLFDKVRLLEEAPHEKIISRVDFVKKSIIAGVTVLITGAVASLGTVVWKLVINLDTIIQAIEKLK